MRCSSTSPFTSSAKRLLIISGGTFPGRKPGSLTCLASAFTVRSVALRTSSAGTSNVKTFFVGDSSTYEVIIGFLPGALCGHLTWCGRRDSNPHGSPHGILSPPRLQVPPLPRRGPPNLARGSPGTALRARRRGGAPSPRPRRGAPKFSVVSLASGASGRSGSVETEGALAGTPGPHDRAGCGIPGPGSARPQPHPRSEARRAHPQHVLGGIAVQREPHDPARPAAAGHPAQHVLDFGLQRPLGAGVILPTGGREDRPRTGRDERTQQ